MKHIHRMQHNEKAVQQWLDSFRHLLASDKFKGEEYACSLCGRHQQGAERQCQSLIAGRLCGGTVTAHRKDWISTADVEAQLAALQAAMLAAE